MFHAQFKATTVSTVTVNHSGHFRPQKPRQCSKPFATIHATDTTPHKTTNTDNGLRQSASHTLPSISAMMARVPPHPGHGNPVTNLNGHTVYSMMAAASMNFLKLYFFVRSTAVKRSINHQMPQP